MICLASYANNATHCWDTILNRHAVNNTTLCVNRDGKTACLKATCVIPPEKEITSPYSRSYRYAIEEP